MTLDPLAAARAVGDAAREHAAASEASRRLEPSLADALRDAGLFRLCVPECYGGPACDPMTLVRAIAEVSAADGAAGWCVMIASTSSALAHRLDPAAAVEVFGDPASVVVGVFAPNGRAATVAGGFRVSGRWAWGSGTSASTCILGGAMTDTGELRLVFVPRAEVELLDTWFSSGLRGTGSTDFCMNDVLVPAERTVLPFAGRAHVDTPLGRFPNFNLLAAGVAAAATGIARRAVDEIVDLAAGKVPQFSSRTLAKSGLAQHDVARADAAVRGATSLLLDELGVSWEAVERGDGVSLRQRARVRGACVHAVQESARAVDIAYHLGGGSSVHSDSVLQRCFRDVHTVTQHIMASPRVLETVGRVMLGVEADTAML